MKEAKIKILCKKDAVLTYLQYHLTLLYTKCKYGDIKENPKVLTRKGLIELTLDIKNKLKRKLGNFIKEINPILRAWEKEFEIPIKENRFYFDVDFFEKKGGIVTIYLKGTEKEIEEWTKIRARDKLALKTTLKPFLSVEVEK